MSTATVSQEYRQHVEYVIENYVFWTALRSQLEQRPNHRYKKYQAALDIFRTDVDTNVATFEQATRRIIERYGSAVDVIGLDAYQDIRDRAILAAVRAAIHARKSARPHDITSA